MHSVKKLPEMCYPLLGNYTIPNSTMLRRAGLLKIGKQREPLMVSGTGCAALREQDELVGQLAAVELVAVLVILAVVCAPTRMVKVPGAPCSTLLI